MRGKDAGTQIGDRQTDPDRSLARQASDRHQATHALHDLVKAGSLGVRARLTEARNTGINQTRLVFGQRFVINAEAKLDVGSEVFHHDVCRRDQFFENRDALRFFEIQRDRAFVAVGELVVRAVLPT